VTCETAPHYLVLADDELADDGRFKMNPPIKTSKDREALLEALTDGTIDMIATDHAPHSKEEKSKGFQGSAYGIVGLETAFPVLYTKLVKEGVVTMAQLIELLTERPNNRFKIKSNMPDEEDPAPTFTVWDLDSLYRIDPAQFLSKGRSTPFDGWTVQGRCMMTVMNGEIVYSRNE
jgi:dihydroorotase